MTSDSSQKTFAEAFEICRQRVKEFSDALTGYLRRCWRRRDMADAAKAKRRRKPHCIRARRGRR